MFFAATCLLLLVSCTSNAARTTKDFNFDWRFNLGDDPTWCEPKYNDTAWEDIHLPHDWSIEGEFSPTHPAGVNGGALPGGIGWYRKHFATPDAARVFIEFDGVYMNSTVYINGREAGGRPYGYSSFNVEATEFLNPTGEDNVVAVRVDHSVQPSGRWYTGSGIYRNVRLVCTNAARFEYQGVYVSTPEISAKEATIAIQTEVNGDAAGAKAVYTIYDKNGKEVASGEGEAPIKLANPKLWDTKNPYLYTAKVALVKDGATLDEVSIRFGIRDTKWDADKGFFLNGKSLKIHGVCMHHDLGCIGSAAYRRALQRQIEILKGAGVNGIRTSHNPPTPELLDLCDEMGILVMDEAFDEWRSGKTRGGYGRFFNDWYVKDLSDMVRRDRNHPSVIMYSIANEISEQGGRTEEANEANMALAREMADIIHAQDKTRAITCGGHQLSATNNLYRSGALDVIGLNYRAFGYDSLRVWFPGVPVIGSETVSAQNSRGIYYQPSTVARVIPPMSRTGYEPVPFQCTSYDNCHAFWSVTVTHQDGWIPVRDRDFVSGTFVWTGFDYLGEPTSFSWPARSSYFGFVDLAGFPKDVYYMYQSEWTDEPMLHLLPHWNWTEGEKIDVWAYYNQADEVELFLNGKSLGKSSKTADRLHAFWPEVVFEPGKLEAVSYKDGKEVCREAIQTTGAPKKLRLTADRKTISADGYDLSYVTVEAVDSKGRAVPTADQMLHFQIKGKGELFGIDNGSACDTLCLKGADKALFSGKAIAVIRSQKGKKGIATLKVSSELGSTTLTIKTK